MKFASPSRVIQLSVARISILRIERCTAFAQHLLMKIAVAISLKLCWFAARTLLNQPARKQASPTA